MPAAITDSDPGAVDGTIGSIRRAELEQHLDECATCRALLDGPAADPRRGGGARPLEPPDRAWLQIAGRLRQEGRVTATGARSRRRALRDLARDRGRAGHRRRARRSVRCCCAQTRRTPEQPPRRPPRATRRPASRPEPWSECGRRAAHREGDRRARERSARRTRTLDPADAATIDKNLGIIDQAIAENRAAVRAEPQSVAARETLFEALRRRSSLLQDTISLINEMRKGNNAAAAQLVRSEQVIMSRLLIDHHAVALAAVALAALPARRARRSTPSASSGPRAARSVVAPRAAANRRDNREEQIERTTRTLRLGANGELELAQHRRRHRRSRAAAAPTSRRDRQDRARPRRQRRREEELQLVRWTSPSAPAAPRCETRYPRTRNRRDNRRNINVSVAYTSRRRPARASPSTRSPGSVKVADIKGDARRRDHQRQRPDRDAGRVATAKTISGDVEIIDSAGRRRADRSSVSGDVLLRSVKARHARARHGQRQRQARRGAVRAGRCASRPAAASSSPARSSANGRYEFSSHSGEVRIAVDGNSGFEIDANSFCGDIQSGPAAHRATRRQAAAIAQRHLRRRRRRPRPHDFTGTIVITKR